MKAGNHHYFFVYLFYFLFLVEQVASWTSLIFLNELFEPEVYPGLKIIYIEQGYCFSPA